MFRQIICLVDYDNVKQVREEKTPSDLEFNLEGILSSVLSCISPTTSNDELILRLYGGWLDEVGSYTRNAEWAWRVIPQLRGRRGKVIIKPALVESLASYPSDILIGTLRMQVQPRKPKPEPRQKMVDCMMALDAIHYSLNESSALIIVTDDDDLVPAVFVACKNLSNKVTWLRNPSNKRCKPNDNLLTRNWINFGAF